MSLPKALETGHPRFGRRFYEQSWFAQWRAGRSLWFLPPIIGKPTCRPIWSRNPEPLTEEKIKNVIGRLWWDL